MTSWRYGVSIRPSSPRALHRALPDLPEVEPAGRDLVEHLLDEVRLDLEPASRRRVPVHLLDRPEDRGAAGGAVEVLETEVVPEHVRDRGP